MELQFPKNIKTHSPKPGLEINGTVIVVDPVSSGYYLRDYLEKMAESAIAIYTMSEEQLHSAGKGLPAEERKRGWDMVIEADEDIALALTKITRRFPLIKAVIPGSEPGVALAEMLAEQLGVIGNPAYSSELRTSKFHMREKIRQSLGGSFPKYTLITHADQLTEKAEDLGYPLVVKALSSAGNDHVSICQNKTDAFKAVERGLGATNIFGRKINKLLIEQFIEGEQYAIDAFVNDYFVNITGIWRVNKQPLENWSGAFTRIELLNTKNIPVSIREPLINYTDDICRTLNIRYGPALIEICNHPIHGPVLIEAASRLIGLNIPRFVRDHSNYDPFVNTIRLFTGQKINRKIDVQYGKGVWIVFVPVYKEGEVKSIENLNLIGNLPSYVESKFFVKPGLKVVPTRDQNTFAARFVIAHKDPDQLAEDEQVIFDSFKLTYIDPEQQESEQQNSY